MSTLTLHCTYRVYRLYDYHADYYLTSVHLYQFMSTATVISGICTCGDYHDNHITIITLLSIQHIDILPDSKPLLEFGRL